LRWGRFLAAPVLCAGLLALTMAGWFRVTLKPFQRHYLIAYLESSFHAKQRDATTEVRWLLKTAPGRTPRIMLPEDGEPATAGDLPVQLSGKALREGWRSVAAGPPERVASGEVAPLLQQAFYPNETLAGMLIEACIASVILLAAAFVYGRAAWRRWGDDLLWEYWKRREAWRDSQPARQALAVALQEAPKPKEKPVPAAAEIVAAPPPKLPPLGTPPLAGPPAKPQEAFVWDKSKGIE
jgi:hypothetical protein